MTDRIAHGDVSVTALIDVETRWEIDDLFEGGPLPGDRDTMAQRMPDEFDRDTWLVRCRCYLVRRGDRTVLVDAGSGPAEALFEGTGVLPDLLAGIGIAPGDVHDVVLTHAHADHFGWCTVPGTDGWTPFFTNARYHLHPADAEAIRARTDERAALVRAILLDPLARSGQLALRAEDHDLISGVRLRHAPGHTPGHRVVGVDTGAENLLLAGDLLHFSYQVAAPGFAFPSDGDPPQANATRTAILAEVEQLGWVLGGSHLPSAFARIVDGRLIAL